MEQWKDNLAALVPQYDQSGGNATLIYTMEGEVGGDRRTVKWNLRRLARLYCVDLEATRCRFGSYLECRQGVPLPISTVLVLVPLKVRRPVGKNDGCYGYFNPAAVEDVAAGRAGNAGSVIVLKGGYRVDCHYAPRTVSKRLKSGEFVLDRFRRETASCRSTADISVLHPEQWRFLESLFVALVRGAGKDQLF